MSRRCEITGKKGGYGHLRSFSNRASKRRFMANLVTKKVFNPKTGKFVRMRIAASTLRTLFKQDSAAVRKAMELLK